MGHMTQTTNPHLVNKEQAGLGLVQDIGVASRDDVLALTRNDCYVGDDPTVVKEAFVNYLNSLGLTYIDGQIGRA